MSVLSFCFILSLNLRDETFINVVFQKYPPDHQTSFVSWDEDGIIGFFFTSTVVSSNVQMFLDLLLLLF